MRALFLAIGAGLALGAQALPAPYLRARQAEEAAKGKVFDAPSRVVWAGDGRFAAYRVERPGGVWTWRKVTREGEKGPAFDHDRLAQSLSTLLSKPVTASTLPLESVAFPDQGTLRFEVGHQAYRCDLSAYRIELEGSKPAVKEETSTPSPDGRWEAAFEDHNLVVRQRSDHAEVLRSRDGSFADGYEGPVYWSPDSSKLVAVRTAKVEERKVWFVESAPKDQLQPRLHTETYAKPGDPLPKDRPQLFDVARRLQLPVSDALAPNPYEISRLRWDEDSSRFTYLYNERGHQLLRVISVEGATGLSKTLVEERSPTFIHYSGKLYLEFIDTAHELLWASERDGWNHLYLIDSRSGVVKRQITKGPWLVRGVEHLDAKARTLTFSAGCFVLGQDPYHLHFARVSLDGGAMVKLTEGDGTHSLTFSPDRSVYLDVWSRVDQPPVAELRRAEDGGLLCEVERADARGLLAAGWRAPERFAAKGRDGKTDIWGVLYRPSTFDPSQSYPVVEYIYAGPHGSHVPKAFRSFHSPQFLAEAGFLVVQMDGMGTSNRSKAFHDVCWKNLSDAGFPDRILWIQALAKRVPQMDLSRGVGIYGGSAGGQSALRALLDHGDFYTAAVSDCGCHDNRVDKLWWNEQWMGWPIGPHYEAQSNATQAAKLRGKLLLTVGEADRNVDPGSTFQVVDALVKADKDFELLVVPGADHWLLEHPYVKRRLVEFFLRAMKGDSSLPPRGAP